jgi:hypothetical protein
VWTLDLSYLPVPRSLPMEQFKDRSKHRLENKIKINLRDIGWDDMDWMYLAQDRASRLAL